MKTPGEVTGDLYMEKWSLDRVRAKARKLLRSRRPGRNVKYAASDVVHNIEVALCRIFDDHPSTENAKLAAEHAFKAGLKWAALQWQISVSKGGRMDGDPAWRYIKELHLRHPKWPVVKKVKEGIRNCKNAGKGCHQDAEYFQKQFNAVVRRRR